MHGSCQESGCCRKLLAIRQVSVKNRAGESAEIVSKLSPRTKVHRRKRIYDLRLAIVIVHESPRNAKERIAAVLKTSRGKLLRVSRRGVLHPVSRLRTLLSMKREGAADHF